MKRPHRRNRCLNRLVNVKALIRRRPLPHSHVITYTQREVISLQQVEHEMQTKLLRIKLENCQEEHKVKMDILKLQKQVLERQFGYRDNNNNASSQSCSSNQNMNLVTRKPILEVCDQVRLKLSAQLQGLARVLKFRL